ncbi:YtxH domain-containing protein [Halalkalibacter urbisdiaboli]|uniref:YtxH domain-containing protein n=1 Tax=Halalkalibacter urbisdiaboli TaxID=1960589 RepID=UPI001FD95579|nr:YtxH domain-containing protein [Halalkalibacter urbisdiaboli]
MKSILYGIVTGAAIASISTLLTAPTSGKELQLECKKKIKSYRHTVQQISNDTIKLTEQVKNTTKVGVNSVKELQIELKDSIEDWKRDVNPSINQLKEDINSLQQNVKNLKQLS